MGLKSNKRYINKQNIFKSVEVIEFKIMKKNCKEGKWLGGDIYLKKIGTTNTKTCEIENINAFMKNSKSKSTN